MRQLGTNGGDLAIVRAIIGLAEAFDLQLIAEGGSNRLCRSDFDEAWVLSCAGFLAVDLIRSRRNGVTAVRALDALAFPR